uniref:ribonuclease H n=1 Tax=Tetraodon nigroviridis TaxID=99883 RepID=H3C3V9_TETNG
MCAATRYPEAIPLRTLKTKAVIKNLINFFSTFGLPKVVQTDQGSNFLSRHFTQVLESLSIQHRKSSAYHPQSQGALERFHQTLKSMLQKYCLESGKEWDEGLPFLMLAARESVQESTGFSPAELVFGHTVRGPLRMLRERYLSVTVSPKQSVIDYVSSFRERLRKACENRAQRAGQKLRNEKPYRGHLKLMIRCYACFQYQVLHSRRSSVVRIGLRRSVDETDYVISTPDRRRKSCVCHVNMLKPERWSASHSRGFVHAPSQWLVNMRRHLGHLDESAQEDISHLIHSNLSLFSDTPTRTTAIYHDIDVGEHAPIKQHAYRVNPTKRALLQQEVAYLLENDLAIPSTSAWSSPCLLVPKPDKTHRFCTAYRKVNQVAKPDSYPLPRMEDCVDRVGAAKFVTKLDLLKGYWQVPLTPRASEISAFVTPDSFLQYTVMPFGLRNAPATFQRLMHKVLSGVRNCEVYLDDIVAYSKTWTEHLVTLREIFDRLRQVSLTLNLAKCEFGCATVSYLGKQVGQGQVRALADKVQAILDFPVPQTRR